MVTIWASVIASFPPAEAGIRRIFGGILGTCTLLHGRKAVLVFDACRTFLAERLWLGA
jgi:hypothetical protein